MPQPVRARTARKRKSASRRQASSGIAADWAGEGRRPSLRTHRVAALALAVLASALFLVALRTDLIRVRYGLARAMETERILRQEQRELQVEVRRLRQPGRLADRARKLGFVRPDRVIDLSGGVSRGGAGLLASRVPSQPRMHP